MNHWSPAHCLTAAVLGLLLIRILAIGLANVIERCWERVPSPRLYTSADILDNTRLVSSSLLLQESTNGGAQALENVRIIIAASSLFATGLAGDESVTAAL